MGPRADQGRSSSTSCRYLPGLVLPNMPVSFLHRSLHGGSPKAMTFKELHPSFNDSPVIHVHQELQHSSSFLTSSIASQNLGSGSLTVCAALSSLRSCMSLAAWLPPHPKDLAAPPAAHPLMQQLRAAPTSISCMEPPGGALRTTLPHPNTRSANLPLLEICLGSPLIKIDYHGLLTANEH